MIGQEIFDFVVRAIIKQGAPSAEPFGDGIMCLYRGPGGRKCAVGHLIPDDLYDPDMETRDFGNLLAVFPALQTVFEDGEGLMTALQAAHDDAAQAEAENGAPDPGYFVRWFKAHAQRVAYVYDLDPAAVNEGPAK